MFMVFNKEKISSYMVLLSTVIILFGFAVFFNKDEAIQTSTNTQKNNTTRIEMKNSINCIFED